MFTDQTKLRLASGKGGNGIVAWHREKYIPKGGPSGGNGGCGGSVILRADEGLFSLEEYRQRRLLRAEDGQAGGANRRRGRNGKDLVIKLPCGTLVKDAKTGEVLHDLTEKGQQVVLCEGGRGGLGNARFKSSTNQAPIKCTPGWDGGEREIEFELKLIADVGLVGFPNAGKSTFIKAATQVPVKIAPYPFTTLRPNLGYIRYTDYTRLLLADIPGIIEGAHANRGLGFEFLKHIERTRVLLYVLDASGIDGRTPADDYEVLLKELEAYDPELLTRPFLVVLNKVDTPEAAALVKEFRERFDLGESLFEASALEGTGVKPISLALHRLSQASKGEHHEVDGTGH
jgi:GTPase